jgi:hypothetical protein
MVKPKMTAAELRNEIQRQVDPTRSTVNIKIHLNADGSWYAGGDFRGSHSEEPNRSIHLSLQQVQEDLKNRYDCSG